MRLMSNFSYKDAKGQLIQIPVRYGDMNRQVGSILKKNSENTVPSAPFIACYIKDVKFDRARLQDPTFVSKVNIRERDIDPATGDLLFTQGANYTVERIMPSPYVVTFAADVWTTNTEMKLQIFEQLAVLFNPSLDLQSTDNYIDWTSLSIIELTDQGVWSSRQIPQGIEQDIDILNLVFRSPIWITPPAKVKKLGIITKIISNIFTGPEGEFNTLEDSYSNQVFGTPDSTVVITPGNFELLVLNNTAKLMLDNYSNSEKDEYGQVTQSWNTLLSLYPGKFRAGLSQLRLSKPDGSEIVAYISLNPLDETIMSLNFDSDTIPSNTTISGRGTVDAIINPDTFNPTSKVAGTRYLILENINLDSPAWKNLDDSSLVANANDIIEWDGEAWNIIFDSTQSNDVIYVRNAYTGIQYKWSDQSWSKSFEGLYDRALWRLVL
jgi:hypothetical protein